MGGRTGTSLGSSALGPDSLSGILEGKASEVPPSRPSTGRGEAEGHRAVAQGGGPGDCSLHLPVYYRRRLGARRTAIRATWHLQ